MVDYIRVAPEQVPVGRTALMLFVEDGMLCAGLLERRCDGRVERRKPDHPKSDDLVPTLCRLMAQQAESDAVYVVLEPAAYWPDPFPALRVDFYRRWVDHAE